MIRKETVTVGSDAELPVFLLDGTPIPVTGLVGGTKDQPRPLGRLPKGFMIQEDNVNAEFNIPPASNGEQFEHNILVGVEGVQKELPPTMFVQAVAATEYKIELLKPPGLQVFGCDPDYNAWTKEENSKPKCDNPCLRTAAAHVHIGWADPTDDDRMALVRALDFRLGYAYIGADDKRRRQLYGKAGAHRPKVYGVEYRVLGNAWLQRGGPSDVFRSVLQAVDDVNNGLTFTEEEQTALIAAINDDARSNIIELKLETLRHASRDVTGMKYVKAILPKEKKRSLNPATTTRFFANRF